MLVALTLEINRCNKKSERYQKLFRLKLDKYLEAIPEIYKSGDNYYYYFLESILDKCVSRYDELLENLFDNIRYHSFGVTINFSNLRYDMNNIFFRRIIQDSDFKVLFYDTLRSFQPPLIPKLSPSNKDKKLVGSDRKNLQEVRKMVRICFKLDVETQIDIAFSAYLKNNYTLVKSTVITDNQEKDSEILSKTDKYEIIEKEKTVDYKTRIMWEKGRMDNLSNPDTITLVLICTNCDRLYPYSLNIEKILLEKIPCLLCKKNALNYYDFIKELDDNFPPGKNKIAIV